MIKDDEGHSSNAKTVREILKGGIGDHFDNGTSLSGVSLSTVERAVTQIMLRWSIVNKRRRTEQWADLPVRWVLNEQIVVRVVGLLFENANRIL